MDNWKRTHRLYDSDEEVNSITVGNSFSHKVTYFAEGETPTFDSSDSEDSSSEDWEDQKITFLGIGEEIWEDALVISLQMEDSLVRRTLVDDGSSVNVLFQGAADEMGIAPGDIISTSVALVDFRGDTKQTTGHVTLWTHVEGINMMADFHIIDTPSAYNAIVGRPWIHSMMGIPSTYHQCLKFPTPWGIREVKGDRHEARICYRESLQPRRYAPFT